MSSVAVSTSFLVSSQRNNVSSVSYFRSTRLTRILTQDQSNKYACLRRVGRYHHLESHWNHNKTRESIHVSRKLSCVLSAEKKDFFWSLVQNVLLRSPACMYINFHQKIHYDLSYFKYCLWIVKINFRFRRCFQKIKTRALFSESAHWSHTNNCELSNSSTTTP